MEEELNDLEYQADKHKEYLEKIMNSKAMGVMVILVPAFIMGWKASKMLTRKPAPSVNKPKRIKHHALKLLKFGLLSSLSHFRGKFGV